MQFKIYFITVPLVLSTLTYIITSQFIPLYTAFSIVAPGNGEQISSPNNELNNFSRILGGTAGQAAMSPTEMAKLIIKSEFFLKGFIQKYNLEPELLAINSYDKSNNLLITDTSKFNPKTKEWLAKEPEYQNPQLRLNMAYMNLNSKLSVVDDRFTGATTITLDTPSPTLSVKWLNLLIEEVNFLLKSKKKSEYQRQISFLENELLKRTDTEGRNMIYDLIFSTTNKLMMVDSTNSFALESVASAYPPLKPSSPRKVLISFAFFIFGLILVTIIAFLKIYLKQQEKHFHE
ncbi:MAG: hypothetical protein KDC67_05160 [Ignavibacteriae bacterium]|nr:hypothetical protein [Ignavibacteriota bacterium]